MLDTHARRYVQPIIHRTAEGLLKVGLTANQVTFIAFLVGVSSGLFVYLGYYYIAFLTLWLSGFLDAVDGSMARLTKTSGWGTVLDVTFDRVVEISIILALAYRYPDFMWSFLLLSVAIILSMTVFLTVGAVSDKQSNKSFYYQAGLAERTEGFILFSLMILFPAFLLEITLLFFAAVLFTAGQRLWEARKLLREI